MVEVTETEVTKTDRVELSRAEYDVLSSIFNQAKGETNTNKFKIKKVIIIATTPIPVTGQLVDEESEVVLDLTVV
mgnify:FL=1